MSQQKMYKKELKKHSKNLISNEVLWNKYNELTK